jgi:putative lipoprotein
LRRFLVLSLFAAMTACAGGHKPPAAPATPQLPPTPLPSPAPPPGAVASPTPPAVARDTASITGVVTYRQRIALTPEAVVQVELRDVSLQDVEAPLIARQIIERPGQVPIGFSLDYDPAAIEKGRTYAISARITDRGQLQFVTDARVPVLAEGALTPVEIVVVPVR